MVKVSNIAISGLSLSLFRSVVVACKSLGSAEKVFIARSCLISSVSFDRLEVQTKFTFQPFFNKEYKIPKTR